MTNNNKKSLGDDPPLNPPPTRTSDCALRLGKCTT